MILISNNSLSSVFCIVIKEVESIKFALLGAIPLTILPPPLEKQNFISKPSYYLTNLKIIRASNRVLKHSSLSAGLQKCYFNGIKS